MDDQALTIAEAASLIRGRKLSPVELTEDCLRRITAFDDQLDSFVTLTAARARQDARTAEAEIMRSGPRSPLHGIPYGLKDIFETAGIRTTAQSRLLAENVPTSDAWTETLLQRAGGILVGKTATWEFAHGGPSWDVLFPPARNPWNPAYSPGGSSSGSAAAVAAGFVPMALGTDTGGSIRAPASLCGVAGLKPTYGLVSRRGVIPNCFSHDYVGPLTATTQDLALVLQVIAGHDPGDPTSADVAIPDYSAGLSGHLAGLRIGVPRHWFEEEVRLAPETLAAFELSLQVLRDLGATIEPIVLPPLIEYDDAKKTMSVTELFTIYERDLRQRPEMFGESFRYRVLAGSLVRAEDYMQASRMRAELTRATLQAFASLDLIVLPTGEPARPLVPVPANSMFTSQNLTTPFNLTGNPALAVPCGFNADGLPMSLQIVGRLFDETTVLRAGDAFERALPSRGRRPVLSPRH